MVDRWAAFVRETELRHPRSGTRRRHRLSVDERAARSSMRFVICAALPLVGTTCPRVVGVFIRTRGRGRNVGYSTSTVCRAEGTSLRRVAGRAAGRKARLVRR